MRSYRVVIIIARVVGVVASNIPAGAASSGEGKERTNPRHTLEHNGAAYHLPFHTGEFSPRDPSIHLRGFPLYCCTKFPAAEPPFPHQQLFHRSRATNFSTAHTAPTFPPHTCRPTRRFDPLTSDRRMTADIVDSEKADFMPGHLEVLDLRIFLGLERAKFSHAKVHATEGTHRHLLICTWDYRP